MNLTSYIKEAEMSSKNNITIEELGREIASRPLCYAQVRSGLTSPVVTAMRVQEVLAFVSTGGNFHSALLDVAI